MQLHKRLRTELPGRVLPPLPRKNKNSVSTVIGGGGDEEASSISSVSSKDTALAEDGSSTRNLTVPSHKRSSSRSSISKALSPKASRENLGESVTLYREEQRVSLRAFLRTLLQNERIAESAAMRDFLSATPIKPNEEEMLDIERRRELDAKRLEEQKQFYEIARKRAQELDVYMEDFRQDIVESSKLNRKRAQVTIRTPWDDNTNSLFHRWSYQVIP